MVAMKGPSDSVSETASAQQRVSVTLASGHHGPRSRSPSSDVHPHPPPTPAPVHTQLALRVEACPCLLGAQVSGTAGAPSVLPGIVSSLCEL